MKKKQAVADANRDSTARKPVSKPRRRAAALIAAAGMLFSPQPAHARTPSTQPIPQPTLPSPAEAGTSVFYPQPAPIEYSEAFRDANFTCETGEGMARITGNVEGGNVEFAVPLDLGKIRGVFRTGSRLRVLSDNYLITSKADGTDPVNIDLPQEARGALSAWLSTESMFYLLSSDGRIHATNPEDMACPWYSGGPFRTAEGARLMEARGLLAIVQGSDTAAILVKVVPDGVWDSLSVRLNFQPEGEPSVSIIASQLRVIFSNCEVTIDIPTEGEIGSVVPVVTRH